MPSTTQNFQEVTYIDSMTMSFITPRGRTSYINDSRGSCSSS